MPITNVPLFRPLLPLRSLRLFLCALDSAFRNLRTSFFQQQIPFQIEKKHNNNDVQIVTLTLPQKTVTTKLTRTQYIPKHRNFFCFSTWSLGDSLFDSGEFEDEIREDHSGGLIFGMLVPAKACFFSSPVDELSVDAE